MKADKALIPFLCAFLGSSLALFGEDNVMTPEKIVGRKRISDPQLSPDGKKVAYVLRSLDREKHAFTTDIYVVDIDTSESIRMTYHPEDDFNPRWSPDGRTIAFLTPRELTEDEEKAKEEKRDEIVVDETMRLNQLAVVDVETTLSCV